MPAAVKDRLEIIYVCSMAIGLETERVSAMCNPVGRTSETIK